MSRRGDCYDAVMESFFSTLKSELADRFDSFGEAKTELFDYIEVFYNQRRRHSTLGQISPAPLSDAPPRHSHHEGRSVAAPERGRRGRRTVVQRIGRKGDVSCGPAPISRSPQVTLGFWRRRPDLNRGWRFCSYCSPIFAVSEILEIPDVYWSNQALLISSRAVSCRRFSSL